jgi:hypothetical protein
MGKEAVVAVIERRGEVIYYKASTIIFADNNNNTKNNLVERKFNKNSLEYAQSRDKTTTL